MNYKKKAKIEQFIFGFVTLIGFCCIGGSVGYFIGTLQKNAQEKMSIPMLTIMAALAIVVIFLAYSINIYIHEIGHMFFGLMTGYKFSSLRLGRLMLTKENGKLHFSRFYMPGTGGQCVMAPPEEDAENMPVVLYNLGGLIMNLLVFLICACLFLKMKAAHPIAGIICLMFALTSLVILLTNGIPLSETGTDGANAIILYKDKNARAAFRNQMLIIKYIADNYSIQDIPKELFLYDKSVAMTNPLITAQAINCFNYLYTSRQYEQAKGMALYILENAKSINQFQEKILYGELLFMTMVVDKDTEAAKKQFEAHKKELTAAAGFISMQRILYAYYCLIEIDEKKAKKYEKLFEKSVKNYPYPKDAATEKEQFDMIHEILREKEAQNI